MSSIVEYFLNTFNRNRKLEDDGDEIVVDTSDLVTYVSTNSPSKTVLKYKECEKSFSGAASVILTNFALNTSLHGPGKKFPVFGMDSLEAIIKNNSGDENCVARQTLMVHASKCAVPTHLAIKLFLAAENLNVIVDESADITRWKDLASQVIGHDQITKIIESHVSKYVQGKPYLSGKRHFHVKFFNGATTQLRGFAGVNVVYINAEHFLEKKKKFSTFQVDLDVCSLIIHELAHIHLRIAANDVNISTPVLAKLHDLPELEFGRCVESAVFGKPYDWCESTIVKYIPESHFLEILNSIETNGVLPRQKHLKSAPIRPDAMLMAIDFEQGNCFLCS